MGNTRFAYVPGQQARRERPENRGSAKASDRGKCPEKSAEKRWADGSWGRGMNSRVKIPARPSKGGTQPGGQEKLGEGKEPLVGDGMGGGGRPGGKGGRDGRPVWGSVNKIVTSGTNLRKLGLKHWEMKKKPHKHLD